MMRIEMLLIIDQLCILKESQNTEYYTSKVILNKKEK